MTRLGAGMVLVSLGVLIAGCGGDPTNDDNNNNGNATGECGDETVDPGEQCDDGTLNSDSQADACRTDCRLAYCGDGVVDPGNSEVCDDGETNNGDGCDTTCQVESGWDCSSGICAEICGDNLAVGNESCDGSDLREQDCVSIGLAPGELACSVLCEWDSTGCVGGYVCGDGTQDPGEGCDDAGESATCDADCTPALCGDGTLNTTAQEVCDDAGESATCDTDCTAALCGDGTVNPTAGEACDDGNIVDGDGCSADCSSVTCPTGSQCVEDPPGTWQGPVAIHLSAVGTALPMCPLGYPVHQSDLYDGLLTSGDCDCDCAPPTGTTCANVFLHSYSTAACSGPSTPQVLQQEICTGITLGAGFRNFIFAAPAVTGGTCNDVVLDTLQTPSWQDQVRTCGGAAVSGAGCTPGQVCAPDPGAGFDSQLCIFSAGSGSCPLGSSYSQQHVYYASFLDTRFCGSCSCATASGSCGGSIGFTSDCSGFPAIYGSVSAPDTCTNLPFSDNTPSVTYVPTSGGSCQPSAGSVLGAATGTGAVTLCCMP